MPDWQDLTARLAAARDLSRHLAQEDATMLASFDARSARKIAAHHGLGDENGKHSVNPDDLANGKWAGSNIGRHVVKSEPANRGNT